MRKTSFLLIFGNILLSGLALHAQILNGSFSDGLTGWTSLGKVQAVSDNNSPYSFSEAFLQSTNDSSDTADGAGPINSSDAVLVTDIDTALHVTIPDIDGRPPTDGEAIYQSFTLSNSATLSFNASYATDDSTPLDSAGYILDGTYTQLFATPILAQPDPSAYSHFTVDLTSGSHTLAFVAFNTHDDGFSTSLYVTDIGFVPEPTTWLLLILGLGGIGLAMRVKSRVS